MFYPSAVACDVSNRVLILTNSHPGEFAKEYLQGL